MRGIYSPELKELVEELQWMKGFYIGKFYDEKEDSFRVRLTRKGEAADVRIFLCKAANKTSYVGEQGSPSSFSMAVRNLITNSVVESVGLLNDDRIIIIRTAKGAATPYGIVAEMFGKGNLIVVDGEMKILLAYRHHKFTDRSIATGIKYVPPKKSTEKETKKAASSGFLIYRDGDHKVVDYSIGEIDKYKDLEKQRFESLGEALDRIYYEEETSMRQKAAGSETSKREIEIAHSIEKQEKIIKSAIAESEESRKAGEIMFANMTELNKAIEMARLNKRITVEELASRFPKLKIRRIDLKKKTFTITVE